MRTTAQRLTGAAFAALLLLVPGAATAELSYGPLLVHDQSISPLGRATAAAGFSPALSAVGPLGYLVVWSEATGGANGSDIYGRGMTATGDYYGPSFVIASHPGNQDNPILTYDGSRFLVVWHDQPSDSLVARVVHLDGPGAGGEFVIATGAGRASIASDGQAWNRTPNLGIVLVVWESSNYYPGSQGDISGQFFNVGFNGVITPGLSGSGYHSMAHESAPSVAFGGSRFLVTWNTEPVVNDDANRNIYGFVMTADGHTAWGEFPITTAPSWQHNTGGNIAFDGTNFLVVWDDHRAGGYFEDVYAARVTPGGVLLDGPPDGGGIPVSLDAGEGLPHGSRVVALEDSWLVVWGGTRARAARVAFDGVVRDPVGVGLSAGEGTQFFPGVASDGRNVLVTWGRDPAGVYAQMVGVRPDSAQDLIGEVESLVAAGRLSVHDGVRLVRELNAALALAKPGAMVGALNKFIWLVQNVYMVDRIRFADGVSLILQAKWLLPAPRPVTPPPAGLVSNVDLGNPADEALHALEGWNYVLDPGLLPPEIDADRTARYQLLRGSNSVTLAVPRPGVRHGLSFRTGDGFCDDSFDVYVNGAGPVYSYRADPRPYTFWPLHEAMVDGSLLASPTARVTFLNTATDSCGLAATYFVRLTTRAVTK